MRAIPASLICLALILGLAPAPALAHRVNVYAYEQGGRLVGEGYFSGGKKAMNCRVELLAKDKTRLAEGTTDAKGAFSFALPDAEPPLTIMLHAGQGHQASYVLTAKDLGQEQAAASSLKTHVTAPNSEPAARAALDETALTRAVETALDKRLAPLQAQIARLAEEREKVGLTEIISGLGWIMGLLGVAMYFKSRKED